MSPKDTPEARGSVAKESKPGGGVPFGLRVSGFRASGLGFRASGFRASGFGVGASGFRVQGFRV